MRGSSRLRTGSYGFLLFVVVLAIVLVGVLPHPSEGQIRDARLTSWLAIATLLVIFIILAGKAITGYWRGALIDDRNQISLSRFQLAAWTSLILSAFLEAALSNIRLVPNQTPISIGVPAEAWALLGIATTSLVASPLILGTKKDRQPDPVQEVSVRTALIADGITPTLQGQVVAFACADDASWSDMFTGDETSNATQLDLGKVQMFFFTLILVLAYGVAIGSMFLHTIGKIEQLPVFDPGMVALLGISHAGYLANKAVPRSDPAAPPAAPAAAPPAAPPATPVL